MSCRLIHHLEKHLTLQVLRAVKGDGRFQGDDISSEIYARLCEIGVWLPILIYRLIHWPHPRVWRVMPSQPRFSTNENPEDVPAGEQLTREKAALNAAEFEI